MTTRRGERAEVMLPDGTRLLLAPASTVRYTADYGVARREVSLEGQALFTVTHDARRPFVVRAGHLVAEDLGTAFVARAYRDDPHASVVVRDGRVAIAGRIVAPGQLGRLSATGQPIVEPVDTASWFAWTRGRLVFTDTPLAEVLRQLGRWYDVDARAVDSTAARRRLTASYSTEPLADVLQLVAASLDLRLDRRGRTVTFAARIDSHP